MPIKSYLAHPHEGKKRILIDAINALGNCEVIPAENENLLIVVTDTNSEEQEHNLKEKIENLESLKLLAMVSGFNVEENN